MDTTAIDTILEAQGYIAIFWHLDDVKEVRPDLTDTQCQEVLQACERQHDANIGISWEVLRIHAAVLFPTKEGALL